MAERIEEQERQNYRARDLTRNLQMRFAPSELISVVKACYVKDSIILMLLFIDMLLNALLQILKGLY